MGNSATSGKKRRAPSGVRAVGAGLSATNYNGSTNVWTGPSGKPVGWSENEDEPVVAFTHSAGTVGKQLSTKPVSADRIKAAYGKGSGSAGGKSAGSYLAWKNNKKLKGIR